jgi:hypothetical protein
MNRMNRLKVNLLIAAVVAIVMAAAARGRQTEQPQFKYAGGTENLPENCAGLLEMSQEGMVFRCAQQSIAIPFASISFMQYRPEVSRRVRKLKPKWKVLPLEAGGSKNRNRYFTIVYAGDGAPHVMVLEVRPLDMRPYLAEIEMKSGQRVEVKGYEPYE